jgi:hypothetical protein
MTSLFFSPTNTASPVVMPSSLSNVRVGFVEGVPMITMRSRQQVSRKRSTSQEIGADGHRFEMIRIDASTVPAEMVKLQPVRDISDQKSIGDDMCSDVLLNVLEPKGTVARVKASGFPNPTAFRFLNLRPETSFILFVHRALQG